MAEHPQTSGAPLPVVELRIDGAGEDGEGEIVVRMLGQMTGYWGQDGDGASTRMGSSTPAISAAWSTACSTSPAEPRT